MSKCELVGLGSGPKMGMIDLIRKCGVPDSTGQWGGLTWQLVVGL